MIGKDTLYLKLNNDLYYFEEQRRKKRPAVYWLVFLLCGVLGLTASWLFLWIAAAAFLAGVTAVAQKWKLSRWINETKAEIDALLNS